MNFYQDAEQIYHVMRMFFERLRDMEPDPVATLVSSRLIVRLVLKEPDAEITLNGRRQPVDITYGKSNGKADLELILTAQQMHLILLDEYSVKRGFMNGELQVRGPIFKALTFADLFVKGRPTYPKILQEQGLV